MTPEPVAEEAKRVNVAPPIRHYYKVMGFGVERVEAHAPDGTPIVEQHLNFLVSPIEVIVIEIRDEDKADLVRALTGGIVVPEMRV